MANRRDAGVFKLENGCWAYRFTVKVDGETITRRKTVDDNGLKFRTKTDAIKAREAALQDVIAQRVKKKPTYRHTFIRSVGAFGLTSSHSLIVDFVPILRIR